MLTHTATIRIPSGVKKIFSIYALVMIGAVALKNNNLLKNTRSGF
jgi:ribosomal protein L2